MTTFNKGETFGRNNQKVGTTRRNSDRLKGYLSKQQTKLVGLLFPNFPIVNMLNTVDNGSTNDRRTGNTREDSHESFDSDDHDFEDAEHELKDQLVPLEDVTMRHKDLRQRRGMDREKSVLEVLTEVKRSTTIDLETGKEGGTRSQCALIREDFEREPQSRRRRGIRKIIKTVLKPFRPKKDPSKNPRTKTRTKRAIGSNKAISRRTISVPMGDDTQYQIRSIDEYKGKGMEKLYDDRQNSGWLCGFSAERMVTSYLFWAFRSNFIAVLVSAAVWFGWITFSFGTLLYLFAGWHPNCMSVAGEDFSGQFMDAYSLSWTTFTTVVRSSYLFGNIHYKFFVPFAHGFNLFSISLLISGLWSCFSWDVGHSGKP